MTTAKYSSRAAKSQRPDDSTALEGPRVAIRLTPEEGAKVDAAIIGAMQSGLGRVSVCDVLRAGLLRLGPKARITAEEVAVIRASDRRRK